MNQSLIDLYEAAHTFNKTIDWNIFDYPEPIIYTHPKTNENYYVHFAMPHLLRVHIGGKGLYGYTEYKTCESMDDPFEIERYAKRQNMMEVEFVDRESLSEDAYEEIDSLGLSFQGKKQWPAFARMVPGQIPWHIEKFLEIEIFTEILETLPSLLENYVLNDGAAIHMTKKGNQWAPAILEEWTGLLEPTYYALPYLDELKAHRVRKLPILAERYEMTQTFFPEPVLEERMSPIPFFPTLTVLVDPFEEQVLWHHISGHSVEELSKIPDALAAFFIKQNMRPAMIEVEDDALEELLSDFAEKTDIELDFGDAFLALEFVEEMFEATESFDEDEQFAAIEETINKLFNEMLQSDSVKFKKEEAATLHELFFMSFAFMASQFQEMLPHWTVGSFKAMVSSGALERIGAPHKIYPMLERILKAMDDVGMVHNHQELIGVLKAR